MMQAAEGRTVGQLETCSTAERPAASGHQRQRSKRQQAKHPDPRRSSHSSIGCCNAKLLMHRLLTMSLVLAEGALAGSKATSRMSASRRSTSEIRGAMACTLAVGGAERTSARTYCMGKRAVPSSSHMDSHACYTSSGTPAPAGDSSTPGSAVSAILALTPAGARVRQHQ